MTPDLSGKQLLVTGATEGIGKAAALAFAEQGASVAIVGRSPEKTHRTVELLRTAARPEARIEFYLGDLSRLGEVRRIAGEFLSTHSQLDVLVNNAGAVFRRNQPSADGLEMTFALNHLSPFLLTRLLSEVLRRTPGSRVITTSSNAHAMGKLDLATVARREGKRSAGFAAYGDSKLANVLFTRELARRLGPDGVTVACFHPGYVHSGFAQNNGGFLAALLRRVSPLIARTPQKGAETLVWLASTKDVEPLQGGYYVDRKRVTPAKRGRDDALAGKLWELSEALVR